MTNERSGTGEGSRRASEDAATASPDRTPGRAPSRLQSRLAEYIGRLEGRSVQVGALRQFPVGFSWTTFGYRAERPEGSREEILRIGPPHGLFAPYSAAPQFLSLRALEGTGVPAPRAYAWSDDAAVLGGPFFTCERVEGEAPVPWGAGVAPSERASLARDFVDALVSLHRLDWRRTPLAAWGEGLTPGDAARRQVERWRIDHARWALRPHPMLHRAFAWLRAHLPVAPAISVVHGDYRLGNFLAVGGRITAILDWELVHLGDPVEDLGWAMLPQYRGGTGLVSGLASEEEFLGRYEEGVGRAVDRAALRFHVVFALVKLACTHVAAARCFEDGRFDDARMPAMATQIAPVLRQIEKMLEAP